jgi:arylsulfatase A-like enzyme
MLIFVPWHRPISGCNLLTWRSHIPDRPNILLVHVDQHRYDCIAAHGHRLLKTPAMDRLIREGCDFHQAYTPSPICSPARASLISGQWPSRHGVVSIPPTEAGDQIDPATPLLWTILPEAGYRQALIGKYHNEAPKPVRDYLDLYIDEESDYAKWRAAQRVPSLKPTNGWFGEVDPHVNADTHRLGFEARHVLDAISAYTTEKRPWFIRWDPSEPHLPNRIPPEYADLYPPASIDPWPSFPDPLEGKPAMQKQQRRTWATEGWTWERWAPVVSRYLAEISLIDHHLGRMLDHLDQLGIADNTLVIYSTDHGDYCGGHGQMDKNYAMYDDIVRVPLMMRWPGRIKPMSQSNAFVSNELDIAATIANAATGRIPDSFQGVDLLPVTAGGDTGRDDIFAQYFGAQFGLYSQRMVRDRRFKYVYNAVDIDELYDTQSDPGELRNLAQLPEHQPTLMHLRMRMMRWMSEIRDPLLNTFTRPHFTTPGVKI